MRYTATLVAVCTVAALAGTMAAAQKPTTAPATRRDVTVQAVVTQYCVGCHNSRMKAAELALDTLDAGDAAAHPEVWEKVVRKLRAGAMPPPGLPRPDDATYDRVASRLEQALDAAAQRRPSPGAPRLHRLNRTEYANAIRDLLALDVDASSLLPPDDASAGFDNNAGLLGISPTLLERYLSAAAKISALAVGNAALLGPASHTYVVRGDLSQDAHLDGLPLGTRGGVAATHLFPLTGEYVLKVALLQTNLGAIRGLIEPHEIEFSIDGVRVFHATVGGDADNAKSAANAAAIIAELDARLTARVTVVAGPHVLAAAFLKRPSAQGGSRLQPVLRTTIDASDHTGLPHVASLTVTGPYNAAGPGDTPARRRIFVCRPEGPAAVSDAACARTILTTLARRAYRRPPTAAETERLLTLYRTGRQQGSFETGIEFGLRGILANPKFVFRAERDPVVAVAGSSYRIDDYELASRLSFFIWSSIPDDQLLSWAARGRLHERPVLEAQVRRMMADARAESLVRNFAGQWLQLRNLRSALPDKEAFPDFDDNLRQAFQRETELFVASIMREDRSVVDLLTADYTFVDERLARHYGISGVYGSHFRRVTIPQPARRGLLGHGSILTVTSHGNRTSPVVRGKWILDNLLGTPPPPPPPNVPPLDEGEGVAPKSMRERMEQHRRNPVCANCHRIMDPIGLALENFDAVGAWRTVDASTAIDASGQLADGAKVDGPVSLREALLRRRELFVSTLTEKLLIYALGRTVEHSDMPAIRAIVRAAARDQFRWSSLVLGVVTSPQFQMRAAPPLTPASIRRSAVDRPVHEVAARTE
jgi:mono/diheme cytochrome c family protein